MHDSSEGKPAFRAIVILVCFLTCGLAVQLDAAVRKHGDIHHPLHERYWWLDEIRAAAQALARARDGRAAQWPDMTVAAGSGTLPAPKVATAIRTDGRLDEAAWRSATSFPVGPIFADWRQGPFMLQVSACCDDSKLYLAIESPRDLSDLGTVFGAGALFAQYKHWYEPCFYAFKKGQAPRWHGPTNERTVWEHDKPHINDLHPTMKPVALIEYQVLNNTKGSDIVLDLFGGSGSTLISCQKTGRHCRMMELDPIYCDVIIKRWQDFTGKKAVLLGGKSFKKVGKKRKKYG